MWRIGNCIGCFIDCLMQHLQCAIVSIIIVSIAVSAWRLSMAMSVTVTLHRSLDHTAVRVCAAATGDLINSYTI